MDREIDDSPRIKNTVDPHLTEARLKAYMRLNNACSWAIQQLRIQADMLEDWPDDSAGVGRRQHIAGRIREVVGGLVESQARVLDS